MTHPQVEQAMQKADEFLAAYPTLCQYGTCLFTHTFMCNGFVLFCLWGSVAINGVALDVVCGLNGLDEIAVHWMG